MYLHCLPRRYKMARQDLERDLPPPAKEPYDFIWDKVVRHRLGWTQQDVMLQTQIIRAYFDTPEGKRTAARLLNAEVNQASPLYNYYKEGFKGDPSERVSSTSLW